MKMMKQMKTCWTAKIMMFYDILLWLNLKMVKFYSKRIFAGQDGIKGGAMANIEPNYSKDQQRGIVTQMGDGTFDRKILRLKLSFFRSNQ